MTQKNAFAKIKSLWKSYNTTILLALLIIIFSGYALFVAINLRQDIVPDEPYHFKVAKEFSSAWGIPEETPTSKGLGLYISQNPYLSYWIFARTLNFFTRLQPEASTWQQLVFLRMINTLFSVGNVLFTYLFAKELINNKWWQLLPVFVLTNTLMFVLLSGGVSYDNPANMFSIAGVFYLVRVLKKKDFTMNSLCWLIFISLGTLTKVTILPLAFAMGIVWLIYIIKEKPQVNLNQHIHARGVLLALTLILLVTANLSLYGINLVKHRSLTPSCRDYYSEDFCDRTGFAERREALGLDEKMTVFIAFRRGYPEPLRYAFDTWIRAMLNKIFGIMGGQKSYYPIGIAYYHMLLYWLIALGIRYFRKASFKLYSLIAIFGFYALILFIKNYDIELAYGFIQVAHQGRYIFPVISLAFGLMSYGLMKVPNKLVQLSTLIITILLFLYGGPIRFLLYYTSVFSDWFV